jgi:hypothetical protein
MSRLEGVSGAGTCAEPHDRKRSTGKLAAHTSARAVPVGHNWRFGLDSYAVRKLHWKDAQRHVVNSSAYCMRSQ